MKLERSAFRSCSPVCEVTLHTRGSQTSRIPTSREKLAAGRGPGRLFSGYSEPDRGARESVPVR